MKKTLGIIKKTHSRRKKSHSKIKKNHGKIKIYNRNKCATRAKNRGQTEDGGWYRYDPGQSFGLFCLFLMILSLAS